MKLVQIAELLVSVFAVVTLFGFALASFSAWKYRTEIKRAEMRRAAYMNRHARRLRDAEAHCREVEERDEVLTGTS